MWGPVRVFVASLLIFSLCSWTGVSAKWTADISGYDFILDIIVSVSSQHELEELILEDGKVKNNVLLGVYGDECDDVLMNTYSFRAAGRKWGPDAIIIAQAPKDQISGLLNNLPQLPETCTFIAYFQKGKPLRDAILYIPSRSEFSEKELSLWIKEISRAKFVVQNNRDTDVNLYWVNEGTGAVFTGLLRPGDSILQNSYMSHTFVARDSITSQLLNYWIISENEMSVLVDEGKNLTEEELEKDTWNVWHQSRLMKNLFQPNVVPAFTPVGFKKTRLNPELFSEIKEFYERREPYQVKEKPVGPCINQEISPTYMINLSPQLQNKIYKEMQNVLEKWSGTELRGTSLYGIRKYTAGNELRMHVDTIETHVISAIVNVAQDVDEDWELEILDHDGNLHKIAMAPGDVVYYESAKALHGRPKPLKGSHYSNFFLHYMPTKEWNFDWF